MIAFIFLLTVLIILYIIGAGATHGYAKHRWPSKTYYYFSTDDNDRRLAATILWPFWWIFIWPFIKINEVIFSKIEQSAAKQIAKNTARITDLKATKAQVESSNLELEQAELELEKEISKL